MVNNCISGAIKSLYKRIQTSQLNQTEKILLEKLVTKITVYYKDTYNEIFGEVKDYYSEIKYAKLYSKMTDYIVSISDALDGKYDIYDLSNNIFREINYDDKKGKFKIKRLNKY